MFIKQQTEHFERYFILKYFKVLYYSNVFLLLCHDTGIQPVVTLGLPFQGIFRPSGLPEMMKRFSSCGFPFF